jgi:hypothetical protein
MKWTGSTPLYLAQSVDPETGVLIATYDTNESNLSQEDNPKPYAYGEDVGYIFTDFIFPGELIGNAGETVTGVLDRIKNVLGNY